MIRVTRAGKKEFRWGERTYVMGIINVSPDSFSGDGLKDIEAAAVQAFRFEEEGADILDIGGESTRPGAEPVSAKQEEERILPVVKALVKSNLPALISVDTYRASTAQAALETGADWINDVWGLRADPRMGAVSAAGAASVVLMHNRSNPQNASIDLSLGGRYVDISYGDVSAEVAEGLLQSVRIAREAGLSDEQLILDPGIGFGKTTAQNLRLLKELDRLKALGFPLLLGVSRKSFIGYTLNLPPDDRLEGSLAANAYGILHGADILRVHDVRETARLARMLDAIRFA